MTLPPIPLLTGAGILPAGVHDASLATCGAAFATADHSARRRELWTKLCAFVNWVQPFGYFRAVYVDGSFVTDKVAPGDVDLLLEVPEITDDNRHRIATEPEIPLALDHHHVKTTYEVDVYAYIPLVAPPPGDMFEFFQTLRVEEAVRRGLPPGSKRGILKVAL